MNWVQEILQKHEIDFKNEEQVKAICLEIMEYMYENKGFKQSPDEVQSLREFALRNVGFIVPEFWVHGPTFLEIRGVLKTERTFEFANFFHKVLSDKVVELALRLEKDGMKKLRAEREENEKRRLAANKEFEERIKREIKQKQVIESKNQVHCPCCGFALS